jgi:hypothetical protein
MQTFFGLLFISYAFPNFVLFYFSQIREHLNLFFEARNEKLMHEFRNSLKQEIKCFLKKLLFLKLS